MKNRVTIAIVGISGVIAGAINCAQVSAQTLAFPTAEGFGAYTTGARTDLASASVYHVTNLNDSGAGSFRDAVSQSNRFVVFDVSGIVTLESNLVVKSNITIAGQTSPGGFTLYGDKVSFSGANNTISRFIAIRKGEAGVREDASGAANGANMIFDHMSIMWGVDETFSLNWDGKGNALDNITIQDSIIAQGQDRLGHSAGGLMTLPEGNGFSVIRSIFSDNVTRNPKVRGENEFINNVVYGWENAGYIMGDTTGMDSHANAIGNYFIEGPVDGSGPFNSGTANFHIYGEDNWVDANRNGVLDGALVTSYPGADVVATPFAFPTTTAMSAQDALAYVLEHAGPSIIRDAVDTRVVDEILSYGTFGGVIQRETDLFPNYWSDPQYVISRARFTDGDNDGIADNWEAANGLSGSDANDWKNLDASGYTMLEVYVNELGADGEFVSDGGGGGEWSDTTIWGGDMPTLADHAVARGSLTIGSGNAFARQLTFTSGLTMTGGTLDVFDTATMMGGTLTISNATATFGRLLLGQDDQSGSISLTAGGTLQGGTIANNGRPGSVFIDGGTIRATGDIDIRVSSSIGSSGGTIDTNGYSGEYSGVIVGSGTLTKTGSGTLILSGNNSYAGGTNLTGLLKLTHDNAAGTGAISISSSGGTVQLGDGVTVSNDLVTAYIYEILDVPDDDAYATLAGDISMAGNKQIRLKTTGSNAKLNLTGNVLGGSQYFIIKTGHVELSEDGTITSGPAIVGRDGSETSLTLRNNASMTASSLSMGGGKTLTSGSITVMDNATLSIGAANLDLLSTSTSTSTSELNLDGGTTILGGFLKGSTGAGQTSEINFNGGTLRYGGTTANASFLPALTGLTANVQAGGAVIDDNGQVITIAQALVHDASVTTDGGLTKLGTGALTLAGTNTYNGETTVSAGKLVVNGSLTNSDVIVQSGATLGGAGTVLSLTGEAGSIVGPGNSIDTLSVVGAVALDGTLAIELDGSGDGLADILSVGGLLDLGGGAVDFSFVAGGGAIDDVAYIFATYGSLAGTFGENVAGLPDGYYIEYAYDDGGSSNNIALVSGVTPIEGDLDGDGFVGLSDLDIVLTNWNLAVPPGDPRADVSGNGYVGLQDLDTVLQNWNAGMPPTDGAAIPEPASAPVLMLSVLGLMKRR